MAEFAYINGEVVPVAEATISARDRGVIFGDGVYDVARVYHGRPFRLQAHLARLLRCASQIELSGVPAREELEQIINELLDQSGLDDAMIYMQLTRGAALRHLSYPNGLGVTVFVSLERVRRGADKLLVRSRLQ